MKHYNWLLLRKKIRIQETKYLLTCADSCTATIKTYLAAPSSSRSLVVIATPRLDSENSLQDVSKRQLHPGAKFWHIQVP